MEYERLTKIRPIEEWVLDCRKCEHQDKCSELGADEENYHYCINRIGKRLAEIEDKIEQGTLIELPCKVGDTVYVPWIWDGVYGVATVKIEEIKFYDTQMHYMFFIDMDSDDESYNQEFGGWKIDQSIGETVFLTREEAEKRLKELQE